MKKSFTKIGTLLFVIAYLFYISPFIIFGFSSIILENYVPLFYSESNIININDQPVKITLNRDRLLHTVNDHFLSFAIDTSLIIGGKWWSPTGEIEIGTGNMNVKPLDLTNSQLIELTSRLSPAYLRIGGSEADNTLFNYILPQTYELSDQRLDEVIEFAEKTNNDLFFTVNAGPSTRNFFKEWQSDNFEDMLIHLKNIDFEIPIFELGNEPNAFWLIHGIHNQISAEQYVKDFQIFQNLIKEHSPNSRTAGPSVAYWPMIGETPIQIEKEILENIKPDIETWHFYPMQSRRCPIALRRANLESALHPNTMNEFLRFNKNSWISETGHAQCGGEPNLSDRFASSFWWLDQLGQAAKSNIQVVIRQSLIGSNYGLIEENTLQPNPDYYSSILWKKLMTEKVLSTSLENKNSYLRVYAHCSEEKTPTFLLINLHEKISQIAEFENLNLKNAEIYKLSAKNLQSRTVELNNKELTPFSNLEPLINKSSKKIYTIEPQSIHFIRFSTKIPACQ
ncbi:hypothetical protein GF376_01710 [Candidatus Peregrinibacteria bacterium]|nr:hypothetical protein [Candidatus Peregrinibacteria bacterium]